MKPLDKTWRCFQRTKTHDLCFTRWQHRSAILPFTKLLWFHVVAYNRFVYVYGSVVQGVKSTAHWLKMDGCQNVWL